MQLDLPTVLGLLGPGPQPIWGDWLRTLPLAVAGGGPAEAARLPPQTERALARRPGAVAVIPIRGVITARPSFLEFYGLATSVATVAAALREALAAAEVKAVVLDIDSPGGGTAGVGELAAEILAARETKPIIAHANHLAASAAYWIGASASQLEASPSALVGSVGVYILHLDQSGMLEQMGLRPTFVFAGRHKVDGNPFEPLGDDARADMQAIVDEGYGQFVDAVAAGRGATAAEVRSGYGEGRVLTALQARKAGMIDVIRPIEQTLAALGAGQPAPERRRGLSAAMAARRLRLATL
jgi:signal peptide peptidase SppA